MLLATVFGRAPRGAPVFFAGGESPLPDGGGTPCSAASNIVFTRLRLRFGAASPVSAPPPKMSAPNSGIGTSATGAGGSFALSEEAAPLAPTLAGAPGAAAAPADEEDEPEELLSSSFSSSSSSSAGACCQKLPTAPLAGAGAGRDCFFAEAAGGATGAAAFFTGASALPAGLLAPYPKPTSPSLALPSSLSLSSSSSPLELSGTAGFFFLPPDP